ncbi:MAG: dTDP-4-dehydrorhamnose 3,5-epimerase [Pseudomonadota bacterium]
MPLSVEPLEIPAVRLITPVRHEDDRGFFSEAWNRRAWAEAGLDIDFVQDNHALSREAGTVRGLHFQAPPYQQDKLVRVLRGAILDIALDLRSGSPSYGKHVSVKLSAGDGKLLLVPVGFAHGLVTLEPNTELLYKVSGFFAKSHDFGLLWNDPALGIDWGISEDDAILSEKDQRQPSLAELPDYFDYAES